MTMSARWTWMAGLAPLLVAAGTPAAAVTNPLPRADFFAACPFTVVPPSVVAVLTAGRWRSVLAASRIDPPPYEAAGTDFRHESIFIVALPVAPAPPSEAALSARQPEKFDEKTGTLTMFFDVGTGPARPGDAAGAAAGQPCLVAWTEVRKDLQQVIMRTGDGRYIGGARTAAKPKKQLQPVPVGR
jgi:hypothetical protein